MAWVKLDDSMPHHPKVMAAGPDAFALDVAGICYSNRHALDGFIADTSLPAVYPALRSPQRAAERLVEVGRWVREDGGWRIHDIHDFQPSAKEQKDLSKKRAEAGRRGGKASGEARAKQVASSKREAVARTESNPDPTRPDPYPLEGFSNSKYESRLRAICEGVATERGHEGSEPYIRGLMTKAEFVNQALKESTPEIGLKVVQDWPDGAA